jgi:hypothetical protein
MGAYPPHIYQVCLKEYHGYKSIGIALDVEHVTVVTNEVSRAERLPYV